MVDKVNEIVKRVSEEGCTRFCWRGMPGQDIQKINYIFLFLLVPLSPGRVIARKVAGTRSLVDGNMKLVFSSNLLRSTDTLTGKKRVVLPKDLKETEKAYPAGQAKEMVVGTRHHEFQEGRENDLSMLEVLHQLATDSAPTVTNKMLFPIAYLGAYDMYDFSPVSDGKLVSVLKMSSRYNPMGGMQENFFTCFHDCFEKSVENRFLLDYRLVNGKGIPYLDVTSVPGTYRLCGSPRLINRSEDPFILEVESSIERIMDKGPVSDVVV